LTMIKIQCIINDFDILANVTNYEED
jgi:hypothetical protein